MFKIEGLSIRRKKKNSLRTYDFLHGRLFRIIRGYPIISDPFRFVHTRNGGEKTESLPPNWFPRNCLRRVTSRSSRWMQNHHSGFSFRSVNERNSGRELPLPRPVHFRHFLPAWSLAELRDDCFSSPSFRACVLFSSLPVLEFITLAEDSNFIISFTTRDHVLYELHRLLAFAYRVKTLMSISTLAYWYLYIFNCAIFSIIRDDLSWFIFLSTNFPIC